MKGRNPTEAEKRYIDAACSLGCIVCFLQRMRNDWCLPHHIDGRTKPNAHFAILSLCGRHHQPQDPKPRYESVHGNKARFERAYGTEKELLKIQNDLLRRRGLWSDDFVDMSEE